MMMPGHHEPLSAADRILQDRFEQELRALLVGRSIAECVALLTAINAGLAACPVEQQAAAEPISVH